MTDRITNPLRNVDATLVEDAAAAYAEVRRYGPQSAVGEPDDGIVYDTVRWTVDAGADSAHAGDLTNLRAVWNGDLTIAAVIGDRAAPDADTRLWLRLEMGAPTLSGLRTALQSAGIARVPRCAFYGNVDWSTLRAALGDLDLPSAALDLFLDLTAPLPGKLHVSVGDIVGWLGAVDLDDGDYGAALDFRLASSAAGQPTISPDAFYAQVAARAPHLLMTGDERDPQLAVWSTCTPRFVVWFRDEWMQPLGVSRAGQGVVALGGTVTTCTYELGAAESALAFAADAVGAAMSATLGVDPLGGGEPLLVSAVPGDAAAAAAVEVAAAAPGEAIVQALDPLDWFPAQGGWRWNGGGHEPVTLPAPHAPARFSNGNHVTPLLDGARYFVQLEERLLGAAEDGEWLLQTGWWLDHEINLEQRTERYPDAPQTTYLGATLASHWQRMLEGGGAVFALVWNPTGGPLAAAGAVLPPGPLADLWAEVDDWEVPLHALADAYLATHRVAELPNAIAVGALNALGGEAILDGRHRPLAAHHAKMAAVRCSDGLFAFVGGIDVNLDRVNTSLHSDGAVGQIPYHDVHIELAGPAARDVVRTFISRWNDHPPNPDPDPDSGNGKRSTLACSALGMTGGTFELELDGLDVPVDGSYLAAITRTFGNCKGLAGQRILHGGTFVDDEGYAFAPDGDFSTESAILGAIKRARHYIYIEDQYAGNLKIATAVADRIAERKAEIEAGDPASFFVYIVVPRFDPTETELGWVQLVSQLLHAIAAGSLKAAVPAALLAGHVLSKLANVTPPPDHVSHGDPYGYLQSRWTEILSSVDPERRYWERFCLCLPPYRYQGSSRHPSEADRHVYVHSKVVIVDDVWATVGSANMNVRSYALDTEINCSFIDGRTDDLGQRVGVRDLRAALWAEHTGRPAETWTTLPPALYGPLWRALAQHVDPRPDRSVSGTDPVGSRLYVWPEEIALPASRPPTVTWSHAGDPIPLPPTGVTELPLYWWFPEQFGKQPWAPDAEALSPPRIGTAKFAVDGEDGAAYAAFDYLDPP